MPSNVQKLDTNHAETDHPLDVFMRVCGLPTDNAVAVLLQLDRHTIANWRKRELTKLELLALAALYHRIAPFNRT